MENSRNASENHRRFHVLHRLLHIVVIVKFTLLAVTGFLLGLSRFGIAQVLTGWFGGVAVIGGIHRFCATVFYIGVLVHILWLVYYKIVLKGRLTGPGTMIPTKKDFADVCENLRYIFGRGTPPLFDRYSYLQKVDYWAVMLGMQSMGITGVIMWHPEFFAGFLPGYAINIAQHFHFHEAVLAVMYIGFVHMSDTHLVPEVFPLEKSIFNGNISEKRFAEDHPKEWERRTLAQDSLE